MAMDIGLISSPNASAVKIEAGNPGRIEQSEASELDKASQASLIQAVDETEENREPEEKQGESTQELNKLAEDLTDMMSVMRKGLAFKIDDSSGQNVVSVMDVDSGDVIRQIPNEEALELAQKLSEVTGFLMKTEA